MADFCSPPDQPASVSGFPGTSSYGNTIGREKAGVVEKAPGTRGKPSVNTVTVSVTKGLFEVVTETCLLWSPNAYLASGGKTYCIERDGGEQGLWVRLGLEYQL